MGGNTVAWNYDSNGGKMVGFTWNGVPFFYLRNSQGDVVGVYDVDGAIKAWYTYDAWGNVLTAVGELAEVNPIRYRGYYHDTETGYYYCQSRYYNPEWCRWINADVLMDTSVGILGTNMYAYCNNDPVNYSDSTGYSITLAAGLLIGGFVVAGGIGGGFGGNAIANSLGAEGFERAGWIVSGVLTGGALGGVAGWAAPSAAAVLAPYVAAAGPAIAEATQKVFSIAKITFPAWVKNANTFISFLQGMKLNENHIFELSAVKQLYNYAEKFGVDMILNAGHGGKDLWTGPHMHFGDARIHVAITEVAFEWLKNLGVLVQ